ncbi:MAG: FGGY-family carbohydrate kinase [Muribaculaceae bacterium]|nr:FGGY-family carbohydrate kinase [Muribaculaceae bacterium]
MDEKIKKCIESGRAVLGIEFGSTRIKAVLINESGNPIAQGNHEWENRFENGLWTYSEEDIRGGIRDAYANLRKDVAHKYETSIRTLAGIGISGMMHGYMAFDKDDRLLVPFRTWRNTNTGEAARELSQLFNFNIPLRWSISHLYQAVIDKEPHIEEIVFQTTLAGYVHWKLTGEKGIGVGDASGMMPVDTNTGNYNRTMTDSFEELLQSKGISLKIRDLFPKILPAGSIAGKLTKEGAAFLDISGELLPGVPFCPPEGDAGTGMVATNAVRPRTGNVSAGTSSFSMIVLENDLTRPYEEIDIVTTPDGKPVAMVHCNNCTSDINAWVSLMNESLKLFGIDVSASQLYTRLFQYAMTGEADAGGLLSYNFLSGEPIAGVMEGRPLFVRDIDDRFNLANFMRMNLYSALACLKIGNDLLFNNENVKVDKITGHGGFFKTPEVGQRILAAALNSPISVMETAGEGGAWGMALLADFMVRKDAGGKNDPHWNLSLPEFLDKEIFSNVVADVKNPDPNDVEGFNKFIDKYKKGLPIEKTAVATI